MLPQVMEEMQGPLPTGQTLLSARYPGHAVVFGYRDSLLPVLWFTPKQYLFCLCEVSKSEESNSEQNLPLSYIMDATSFPVTSGSRVSQHPSKQMTGKGPSPVS